jgi:hypothetical protein
MKMTIEVVIDDQALAAFFRAAMMTIVIMATVYGSSVAAQLLPLIAPP